MLIGLLHGYNIDTDCMDDGSAIPSSPFQFANILSDGYDDITNIVNWDKYGLKVLDYWQIRSKISTLVYIKSSAYANWTNGLTSDEKLVACQWIAAPYILRAITVGDEEDKINWKRLIVESFGQPVQVYKGRSLVAEKLRQCIGEELRVETISKTDLDLFYADSTLLVDEYTWTNSPNLKNWFLNTAGTPYEYDGFAQKSYYSLDRKNRMIDILINLNY